MCQARAAERARVPLDVSAGPGDWQGPVDASGRREAHRAGRGARGLDAAAAFDGARRRRRRRVGRRRRGRERETPGRPRRTRSRGRARRRRTQGAAARRRSPRRRRSARRAPRAGTTRSRRAGTSATRARGAAVLVPAERIARRVKGSPSRRWRWPRSRTGARRLFFAPVHPPVVHHEVERALHRERRAEKRAQARARGAGPLAIPTIVAITLGAKKKLARSACTHSARTSRGKRRSLSRYTPENRPSTTRHSAREASAAAPSRPRRRRVLARAHHDGEAAEAEAHAKRGVGPLLEERRASVIVAWSPSSRHAPHRHAIILKLPEHAERRRHSLCLSLRRRVRARGSGDIRASGNQATHMTRSARVEARMPAQRRSTRPSRPPRAPLSKSSPDWKTRRSARARSRPLRRAGERTTMDMTTRTA